MNFKNLIFSTLTVSLLLSISGKNTVGRTETEINSSNEYQISYRQSTPKQQSFDYEQAINHQLVGSKIITKFSPKNSDGENISLSQLSTDLGYDHFNWVSYVESDPYGISDRAGQELSTPYIDPPMGGYQYDAADRFPFYWDMVNCDSCIQRYNFQHPSNLGQSELTFLDSPADYRLQPGEAIEFTTNLVGVTSYNRQEQKAEWEILHTFRWQLVNIRPNYNRVFLVDTDVALEELSPTLMTMMATDGAVSLPKVQLTMNN